MVRLRDYFRSKKVNYILEIVYNEEDLGYDGQGIIFISTIERAIEKVPEIKERLVALLDVGQAKPYFVWREMRSEGMKIIGRTEPSFKFSVDARTSALYEDIIRAGGKVPPRSEQKPATLPEPSARASEDKAVSA